MNPSAALRPLFTVCSVGLALSALCLARPGHAESFASSASSAGSASSGSVSDSIKGSSNSSTSDNKVAEGPYRVMQVAEVPVDANRPGRKPMQQLTLRATNAGATREFILELPRVALGDKPLQTGDLVQARHRPYGYEFARGETQQAFFLVLTDDWQRELDSHAVTL